MVRAAYGASKAAIVDALGEHGPMTSGELNAHCDITTAGSLLNRMRHKHKKTPKRVYIHSWRSECVDGETRLRAVYALGDKPCKPKPPARTRARMNRDYLHRCKRIAASVSVFNAGMSQDQARRFVAQLRAA